MMFDERLNRGMRTTAEAKKKIACTLDRMHVKIELLKLSMRLPININGICTVLAHFSKLCVCVFEFESLWGLCKWANHFRIDDSFCGRLGYAFACGR